MKYTITIEQTNTTSIEYEAESMEEAVAEAKHEYCNGLIDMRSNGSYAHATFSDYDHEGESGWQAETFLEW